MGSRAELRGQKRISELEDRTIQMIQSEEQRHRREGKNDQNLRDLQTIIKDQAFVSLESWKDKRMRIDLKTYAEK